MEIIIRETGEKKYLLIPDLDGNDYSLALIQSTSSTYEWDKLANGEWVVTEAEYDWWNKIADNVKAGVTEIPNHARLMEDEAYQALWWAETRGIEHYSQVSDHLFSTIGEGRLTVKRKAVKSKLCLRIVKDVSLISKGFTDGLHEFEFEGVFCLSTKNNRYEIPISATATYKEGDKNITLNSALECPISLRKNQTQTAYGIFFEVVQAELADMGFFDIKSFSLA